MSTELDKVEDLVKVLWNGPRVPVVIGMVCVCAAVGAGLTGHLYIAAAAAGGAIAAFVPVVRATQKLKALRDEE